MDSSITNGLMKDILDQYFVNGTIEALLITEGSSVPTDVDGITFVDTHGTLNECDGANYARKTLAGKTSNADDANDEGEFDFDDLTWLGLGNATTGGIVGILLIRKVTNDTDSPSGIFLALEDTSNPGGGDYTIRIPVGGAILTEQAVVV